MPKIDEDLLKRAKAMRAEPTPAEKVLWERLRAKRFGATKFSHQVVVAPYIVDFVARSHKLIVEVDGHLHGETERYDARRTAYLERKGYRVIRFTNGDVMANPEGVLIAIEQALGTAPLPTLSPKGRGLSA